MELIAKIVDLHGEGDIRLDESPPVAAVEALTFELIRVHGLRVEHPPDRIRQLNLVSRAARLRLEVVENLRREQLAPDHAERRRRVGGRRLLDDAVNSR